MSVQTKRRSFIKLTFVAFAACLLYGISSGIRANYGILINGISQNSGIPYSSVSFILAIAQLVYGITQPLFGILAIKKSNTFVLLTGAVLMAAGLAGIPFCHSIWSLLPFLGIVFPAGTGAMSFGIIMGAISPLMNEKEAAAVSGIVTAGSGLGSTILSPAIQRSISAYGLQTTMFALCIPVLCLIPVSWCISSSAKQVTLVQKSGAGQSMKRMFSDAFRDKSFLFLMIGFFTCGFHMAIIETHLFSQFVSYGIPEETAAYAFSLYGMAVILGSTVSGILDSRFPMRKVLGSIYAFRVVIIFMLLALPKTASILFMIAILLGLTAASTVPPTSGLVGKLFGVRKMATLFGVTFLSHQVGSFFSSWLGGICIQMTNGYPLIWIASIFLSAIAAIASFSIKEPLNYGKQISRRQPAPRRTKTDR